VIYLSGAVLPELAGRDDAGYMLTPLIGNRPDLANPPTLWAHDTGAFREPPEAWTIERQIAYHNRVHRRYLPYRATNLFVTAPDVFGDGRRGWIRSFTTAIPLRYLGWRVAIVAQPGTPLLEDAKLFDLLDCLFLGGPDEWQSSDEAYWLIRQARARAKWVHKGRANSWEAIEGCLKRGIDSCDGTYLAYGPRKNLPHLERWLRRARAQPPLFT
jgi:hypothetical protein